MLANRLQINVDKTYYTVFSYRNDIVIPNVFLNNQIVPFTKTSKFLGIVIDNNLTFSQHYNYICNKISKNTGILNRIHHYLPKSALLSLYYSLIYPYLMYGVEIYYGNNKSNHVKLAICQKKAIRSINCAPYNSHTGIFFKMD